MAAATLSSPPIHAEVAAVRVECGRISTWIDRVAVMRRLQLADKRARAAGRTTNYLATWLAGHPAAVSA